MNKITLGIIVAIIVVGGGIYIFANKQQYSAPTQEQILTTSNNQEIQQGAGSTTTLQTFSTADVSKHNSETSCYTIIRGNVYDVTTFIPKHPGGDKPILTGCGTDSTDTFVRKHGGKQEMEQALEAMKIGTLAQ